MNPKTKHCLYRGACRLGLTSSIPTFSPHSSSPPPEPNSTRLASLKSIRFDSPANNVGQWPASLDHPDSVLIKQSQLRQRLGSSTLPPAVPWGTRPIAQMNPATAKNPTFGYAKNWALGNIDRIQ